MAPNGTSRKSKSWSNLLYSVPTNIMSTAPAASKPSKSESQSRHSNTLFDDEDDDTTLDVGTGSKNGAAAIKKPGNWDSDANTKPAKDSSARSSPKPSLNKVASSLSKAFTNSKPMADRPEILKCAHCKRAVSKHVMPKHIEGCLNKKQEKQRKKKEAKDARDAAARKQNAADSDEEDEEGGKKFTTGGVGKKRKAGEEADGDTGPVKKKKKKDEGGKPKAARPKAPVDVEKQCGVELPLGGQCARSLTCKSHSMGAKRAVPGRSAPYDKLLMEYQRKNQAKLQKAAFEASGQGAEDDENLPTGPVDEEEERDAVMASIARNFGGRPIYQPTMVPLRNKYQHNRIKGMLQSALGGRGGGNGLFGNSGSNSGSGFFGSNATTAPVVDDQGMVHARRGSVVPGARSMMAPVNSRKASLAA